MPQTPNYICILYTIDKSRKYYFSNQKDTSWQKADAIVI